jgi:hypothetical protein
MTELSALEMAVGMLLARQISPDESNVLVEQLKSAQVASRDFTGVGFYTEFKVDKRLAPVSVTKSPSGWVRSEVGPNAYPLEFMLYVRDGYAEMIEAYSFFDGYGDLDLLTAYFTAPKQITPEIVNGG